jgi:DTW domain-containing protein YfiP
MVPSAAMGGRCATCRLAVARCVCALVPRVETRTRITIVRHVIERWKPSNTARLAALALPSCEIVEHGARGGAPPDLAGPDTWLLFPGAAAPPPGRPRRLVVLDGSWPQARRMAQRIPSLRALPRLSLPAPASPPARMRRAADAARLATLEAIARALDLLEGGEVARPLDALLAEVVRRVRAG